MRLTLTLAATLAGLLSTSAAQAQQKPFGPGFENWIVTQAVENGGAWTNCRAIRKVGGRDDLMALRTDNYAYVSVASPGPSTKIPGAIVRTATGDTMVTAALGNGRLAFGPLTEAALRQIAQQGEYVYVLPGAQRQIERVTFGPRAVEALNRVFDCVKAARGGAGAGPVTAKATPGPQVPFGAGFENWIFTRQQETARINCRAIRKTPGRDDIMAMFPDRTGYVSVTYPGPNTKIPGAIVRTAAGDSVVTASLGGGRLAFGPLSEIALRQIAQAGEYVYVLPGAQRQIERVTLPRAKEALDRVVACLK